MICLLLSSLNVIVEKIIALDRITPKKIDKHLIVFTYFGSLNLFQTCIFTILFSYSFFLLKNIHDNIHPSYKFMFY